MGARLMTDHEVALFLNVKRTTLQMWRHKGKGPPFIKVGNRTVRYDRLELENWLEHIDPEPQPKEIKANTFGGPEMPKMRMRRTKFNLESVDD